MTMPYMVFYVEGPSGAGDEASDSAVLGMMQQLGNNTDAVIRAKL